MSHYKPPHYAPDAFPTRQGWHDPRTGELLKAQRIPTEVIAEWLATAEPVDLFEDEVSSDEEE